MASKRSKREENKLEAEILRLELTLKAHKMACQMGVPGACEAADAVREDIEERRRELDRLRGGGVAMKILGGVAVLAGLGAVVVAAQRLSTP